MMSRARSPFASRWWAWEISAAITRACISSSASASSSASWMPIAERARKSPRNSPPKRLPDIESLRGKVDAVSVAVPTVEHAAIGCRLLELGIDVLVEKPMAASLAEADRLIDAAAPRTVASCKSGIWSASIRPCVAVAGIVSRPLYFEVHRLGVFTPRSLDIDVVYDVMIHDLDILLALVDSPVIEVRAVGIPVVTDKVDIAHARLEFASGAVANVTASRVSTERVRKMRFFQEHEYISLDFTRQDALRVRVREYVRRSRALNPAIFALDPGSLMRSVNFEKLPTTPEEPLRAELRAFLDSAITRSHPVVDGHAGRRALELADRVMAGILEHGRRVQLGAYAPQDIR